MLERLVFGLFVFCLMLDVVLMQARRTGNYYNYLYNLIYGNSDLADSFQDALSDMYGGSYND